MTTAEAVPHHHENASPFFQPFKAFLVVNSMLESWRYSLRPFREWVVTAGLVILGGPERW